MKYGEKPYGSLKYGNDADTTVVQPEQDEEAKKHYVDLTQYIPKWLAEITEFDALLKAQGYEIGYLEYNGDDCFSQFFVDSATWGLQRWEKDYGLSTNEQQSYENRRAQIKSKMNIGGICTPERLKALVKETTGSDARIIEDPANYQFIIAFSGDYGLPKNIKILQDAIELIKPAHLQAIYRYNYVVWDDLENRTWNNFRAYTWEAVKLHSSNAMTVWDEVTNAGITCRSIKLYTWDSLKEDNK